MPIFTFRLNGTIEASDESMAKEMLEALPGIEEIDIEDGPDEVKEEEEDDDEA